ncbi:MAG: hypothetical protein P8M04_09610 [Akkermansiaceae bacterium]|nr:hypothetical protein [Akkermansiaceae bacterium]
MKKPFHAISTLGPVRRATAFFALLGFLCLSACSDRQDSPASLLEEQTRVFSEMTEVLSEVANGGDREAATLKIRELGEELKQLKIRLAASLKKLEPSDRASIAGQTEFLEATAAFQKAQEALFRSGRNTHELAKALTTHHNPAPLIGEGKIE